MYVQHVHVCAHAHIAPRAALLCSQVGPEKQCRDMLTSERRTASLVYFGSLLGTIFSVFVLQVSK